MNTNTDLTDLAYREQTELKADVKDKIAKARKMQSTLKQIDKLEKEIATMKKKIELKEQKLTELAQVL
jgi:predicted RNase H-like nuclease (RuvC/YqgF family)